MDLNVSDLVAEQDAARSSTVKIATTKMELCIQEIEFLLRVFKKKLDDKLRPSVSNQRSLQDVFKTMDQFESYFKDVQEQFAAEKNSFQRMLGIILGEDWNQQLLCLESNLSATPDRVRNQGHDSRREASSEVHSLQAPPETRSICGVNENATIMEDGAGPSALCPSNLHPSGASSSGVDAREKPRESDQPQSKGNVNLSNSLESYDSSNDLPEAKTAVAQQSADIPSFDKDSDPSAFNKPENSQSEDRQDLNNKPKNVSEALVQSVDSNLAPELNVNSQIITQVSESLLRNVSPALFEESQGDSNTNVREEPRQTGEQIENEEGQIVAETPSQSADLQSEGGEPHRTEFSRKRRNEMDATSRKVNDWLNNSINSDCSQVTPDDDVVQGSDGAVNDDAETEINEVDPASRNTKESNEDECSSLNTEVLTEDADQPTTKKKSGRTNDIIELSDDDMFGPINSQRTSSPLTKSSKRCRRKQNLSGLSSSEQEPIEIVELEEAANNAEEEVCLIESTSESSSCVESKTPATTNQILDSSDADSQEEAGKAEKSKENSKLESSSSSSKSISNVATQQISPQKVDEAKRNLLESSSSSSEAAVSLSDSLDSEATVLLDKKRKFKKKKKKKQDLTATQGEDLSSEEEDKSEEIKRLLNLKSLKKRRRVEGSSDSATEKSESSGDKNEQTSKRKKKRCKRDEEDFSGTDNQNSEPEVDQSELVPILDSNKDANRDAYRDMLLDDSSPSSEEGTPPSPEALKAAKKNTEVPESNAEKRQAFLDESGKKKRKKTKYDPLLHGNFHLSSSDTEENGERSRKRPSEDSDKYDRKYRKLLEKKKKEEESKSSSDSSDNSDSEGSDPNDPTFEPINFVSADPECVSISEDDSEDDRTTIGYHQISSSSSDEDVQCLPLSQETTISNSGRKNIRKVKSVAEMTEESRRAAKEEEERRRRISDKEAWFSQTFTAPEPEKLVLDADKETKQELVTVHPGLMQVLKEHQIKGVKFMWNTCFESVELVKSTPGSGCVLAHCMGLGKTLQVVALVHTIISHPELNLRCILIVCPKSVILNWGREFKKWLGRVERSDPNCKKVAVHNMKTFRDPHMRERGLRDWQNKGGVMILGYSEFRSLVTPKVVQEGVNTVFDNIRKHLLDPGPDVVVFDEGHMLKNDKADTTKAANQIRTKRRIVLTGTPMQNNLIEYYYMVNLVKPNYLGDKKEFSNRFFNPITNGQFQDSTPQDVKIMKSRAHVLYRKLDPFVQRFDSNLFKDELPARYEYVLKLRASDLQVKLYQRFINSLKKDSEGTQEVDKNRLMLKSDKVLSLIVNHPKLAKEEFDSPANPEEPLNVSGDWQKCLEGLNLDDVNLSPKTALFFEILKECSECEDKLLVFSQHLKTLDLLELFLKNSTNQSATKESSPPRPGQGKWVMGADYFRLDGQTSMEDREKYCRIFNSENKRARLFLLSTKAGGLGLNLTGANRAIVFDVSWNPSTDSQSVFRIYRFGQNKPCYIYRFVMKGTMEEKKYHRQVSKLSMSSRVVDKRQVGRHYQEKYLRALFEYNFDYGQRATPRIPQDIVLTELLRKSEAIDTYEEHENLLMNLQDEELTEEDRVKAMEDYEAERRAALQPPPPPFIPGPSGANVFGPSGVNGPGPSGVYGPGPSGVYGPGPAGVNVSRPSGMYGPGPAGVNVPGPSRENVPKPSGVNVPGPTGVNMPAPGAMKLPKELQKEADFIIKCFSEKKIPLPYARISSATGTKPKSTAKWPTTHGKKSGSVSGNSNKDNPNETIKSHGELRKKLSSASATDFNQKKPFPAVRLTLKDPNSQPSSQPGTDKPGIAQKLPVNPHPPTEKAKSGLDQKQAKPSTPVLLKGSATTSLFTSAQSNRPNQPANTTQQSEKVRDNPTKTKYSAGGAEGGTVKNDRGSFKDHSKPSHSKTKEGSGSTLPSSSLNHDPRDKDYLNQPASTTEETGGYWSSRLKPMAANFASRNKSERKSNDSTSTSQHKATSAEGTSKPTTASSLSSKPKQSGESFRSGANQREPPRASGSGSDFPYKSKADQASFHPVNGSQSGAEPTVNNKKSTQNLASLFTQHKITQGSPFPKNQVNVSRPDSRGNVEKASGSAAPKSIRNPNHTVKIRINTQDASLKSTPKNSQNSAQSTQQSTVTVIPRNSVSKKIGESQADAQGGHTNKKTDSLENGQKSGRISNGAPSNTSASDESESLNIMIKDLKDFVRQKKNETVEAKVSEDNA